MIRVVFDFVDTRTCHHAADLRLFPKCEQIGLNIEMFAAPIATSHPHAALHFVENEKDVVLVANRSQLSEPFPAEMIVASLALDWFDNKRANIDPTLLDELADLALGFLFPLDHIRFALRFRQ